MSKTQTPTDPQELVIVFYQTVDKNGGHYHIRACPKHMRPDGAGLSNGSTELINGWNIEDLEVQAWYSQEFPELNWGSMYDSICYMNVYKMGAQEAMDKAKTLERLEKATRRGEEAKTFGDYVAKVAKAMKIKRFLVCTQARAMMAESTYVELNLKQAITWVNSRGETLPTTKS